MEIVKYDLMMATPLATDTPRSALDAMACGVPIIAFNTDYYSDLCHLSSAVTLVPWLDVETLVHRILALDQDRGELARMAQRGVEFAKKNTQEIWMEKRAAWTKTYCGLAPK